ncbi:MAG TPA: FdrA family protein, partial [Spirochaetales bacterium]|nr:FdrA family protein [Spirochaetales bacterium]
LHVMIFSDNVSLEDEIELKTLALSKGLLLMGPDCGTAILGGKPLCFANVVARGPVGIVAASGTGLQEVSCLVDRAGIGVSQAIGCGGRDLKNEKVGGMTSLFAIEGLERDPETKVLLVVSKPPAPGTAAKVVAALAKGGKPAVVHFLGLKARPADADPVYHAASLEEAAALAAAFAKSGADAAARMAAAAATRVRLDAEAAQGLGELAAREAARLAPGQQFLRGLYAGGTVADEALFIADAALGQVRSNNQTDPALVLADPRKSEGHTIVDLGDDVFTVGKPHPMIDPSQRNARIVEEGRDPQTAVLLLDVVLGYGSHDDPAGASLEAIAEARAAAAARGGYLPVIASVIGTAADPQGYAAQAAKLEAAGVVVMSSNRRAALLAVEIAKAAARGSTAKGGAR